MKFCPRVWRKYTPIHYGERGVTVGPSGTLTEATRWSMECERINGPNGPIAYVVIYDEFGGKIDVDREAELLGGQALYHYNKMNGRATFERVVFPPGRF